MHSFKPWWMMLIVTVSAGALAQENVMRPVTSPPPALNRFAKVDALDFKAILPAPPTAGSLAAEADLEAVLQAQAWRTPEQVAWAKLVETDNVFNYAAVLGRWFTAERLPLTAALFKNVGDDMRALDARAKLPFLRPRPSAVDERVQPCVTVPKSTSYPSGAAMQAWLWAELLGESLPSRRGELIARTQRAAWGRVIGGVHFPSDLVAGRLLAQAYLTECHKNPAFREALDAVRQELSAASAAAR